ncbi:MAG: type II toxin-antitoxin system RelE/ParE family toxin [Bacteroidetes bacterium]|nr:MAG: type II toxin-antitoxin system RelE/ParE family toxin [Bacteroidota bacterium]
MVEYFDIIYSDEVDEFLDSIDEKARNKIIYNVDKAKITLNPELFKKLNSNIWEFRTKFNLKQYRLLAFWDKRNSVKTLVIATNGFIKKTQKTPKSEIERAKKIMEFYFKTN